MRIFQSHKRVTPTPMTREAYNNYRGWLLPNDENGGDDGYLVEHLNGGDGNHPDHEGYISWSPKEQFDNGYTELKTPDTGELSAKSLSNTDQDACRKNVRDVVIFGEDVFRLIAKASSKQEGWMKSTKAMDTGDGCVVQVTTQQRNPDGSYTCAEAVTFVPKVTIYEEELDGVVVERWLDT